MTVPSFMSRLAPIRSVEEVEKSYRRFVMDPWLITLALSSVFGLIQSSMIFRSYLIDLRNPVLELANEGSYVFVAVGIYVYPICRLIIKRKSFDYRALFFGRMRPQASILIGLAAVPVSWFMAALLRFLLTQRIPPIGLYNPIKHYQNLDSDWNFFNLLVSAPLIETMIFQTIIQTLLLRFGRVVSIGVTTIIFATMHLPWYLGFMDSWDLSAAIFVLPALFICALLRWTTGSILSVVIAHSLYNLVTVTFLPDRY